MPNLAVVSTTVLTDKLGQTHVWGDVRNDGDTTQRWPRVTVHLLDDGGVQVAQASDILALEWLDAHSRVPFHVVFVDPVAPWVDYRLEVTGHEHDYEDGSVPQPAAGLAVEAVHYREIGRAGLVCTLMGAVRNTGDQPVTRVKVAGTLYGPDGAVVGSLSPYLIQDGILAERHTARFELKFYLLGGTVADYRVAAQGRQVSVRH